MMLWYHDAMVPGCHGTMVTWYHGIMEPRYQGATDLKPKTRTKDHIPNPSRTHHHHSPSTSSTPTKFSRRSTTYLSSYLSIDLFIIIIIGWRSFEFPSVHQCNEKYKYKYLGETLHVCCVICAHCCSANHQTKRCTRSLLEPTECKSRSEHARCSSPLCLL